MNAQSPIFTAETFEQTRDRLLLAWKAAKETLDLAKATEMDLRNQCVSHLFPEPVEGTQRFDLGAGYAVKLTFKNNYKLADADTVEDTVTVMAQMGPQAKEIADRVVKWKAEMSISEYRRLCERSEKHLESPHSFPEFATEARILRELNNILTITPGAPTLEIEEPKQGRKR